MSLLSVAEEYFSKLNPIATRLHFDIKETKESYEALWNNLPPKDQQQILSDSIVSPELCLRYTNKQDDKMLDEYAKKLIVDDNCSYRDEHSGPFSFKTASQRDLTIFDKEEVCVPIPKLKLAPKEMKEIEECNDRLYEVDDLDQEKHSLTGTLPKTGLDLLDNW